MHSSAAISAGVTAGNPLTFAEWRLQNPPTQEKYLRLVKLINTEKKLEKPTNIFLKISGMNISFFLPFVFLPFIKDVTVALLFWRWITLSTG